MEKHIIKIDGLAATVLSLSCEDISAYSKTGVGDYLRPLLSGLVPSGLCVAVYPSHTADLSLYGVFSEGGLTLELPAAETLVIFSAFWRLVRGTPTREVEVSLGGRRTNVEILDTPRGILAVKLEKCKPMLSFSAELETGISLPITDLLILDTVVRVARVEPSESTLLRSLRMLRSRPDAKITVAIDQATPPRFSEYSPYPTHFTSAVAAASAVYMHLGLPLSERVEAFGLSVYKSGVFDTVVETRAERLSAT